ncbi:Crp/Fnr family transcriptional regulator [Comamonas composti]|uniref:Crp/Fnr family transcriptional regulator n=1 Tax=Comamonas composti TaxID=408558 RepID=UPI0004094380|nr:Crp/Fnr family transcriptional regulator [Comamonas composti]
MSYCFADLEKLALIQRGLRTCALFRTWPDAALDRMARLAHVRCYERHTQVLTQDRPRREVLAVISGCLEVSGVNASGLKFVLGLLGPGEVTGLIRLLKNLTPIYDYHAHEDTTLVHLPCEGLSAVLDAHPHLWKSVAFAALERQRDSVAIIQRRALGCFQQVLAETLVRLSQWHGQPAGSPAMLNLHVSQSDLASMLCVSRQTINKELQLLARQAMLAVKYGHLVILDLPALQELASGPPGMLPPCRPQPPP